MPRAEKLTMPDGVLRLPIGNHYLSRSRIGREKNKNNQNRYSHNNIYASNPRPLINN
jgi:hypothetical protein